MTGRQLRDSAGCKLTVIRRAAFGPWITFTLEEAVRGCAQVMAGVIKVNAGETWSVSHNKVSKSNWAFLGSYTVQVRSRFHGGILCPISQVSKRFQGWFWSRPAARMVAGGLRWWGDQRLWVDSSRKSSHLLQGLHLLKKKDPQSSLMLPWKPIYEVVCSSRKTSDWPWQENWTWPWRGL